MEIYLDNSSTTKVCLPAAEKVMECMTVVYGNPSLYIQWALLPKRNDKSARFHCKTNWGKRKRDYFTSGGTEANNLAVFEQWKPKTLWQ